MTIAISKSEAIEIKKLEQVRVEWLESAKKRNLAPYIIEALSKLATINSLHGMKEMSDKIDRKAADKNMTQIRYLASADDDMRELLQRMIKSELDHLKHQQDGDDSSSKSKPMV